MNDPLSRIIGDSDDPIERFSGIRCYLDERDASNVDSSILKMLLTDDSDLIRAEAADFVIISGGLSSKFLFDLTRKEESELVYPRLWLASARTDPSRARRLIRNLKARNLSNFERCYFDGASYLSFGDAFYLYDLCAIACSRDISASYTAIDVIKIVAGQRVNILKELLADLRRMNAENADKASEVFAS